jgi:hypothetical protein
MRKLLIITAILLTGLGVLPTLSAAAAAGCITTGTQAVSGSGVDSYTVTPDNWGGGNACTGTDSKADFTIQSQSIASTGNVLAYPNISAGCSPGAGTGCTPNWVNKKLSALGKPTETWSTTGSTNAAAEYDVADDIWTAPATTGCSDAELMIFINGQKLPTPSATKVTINGVSYYYKTYKTNNTKCSWTYIQFRRVTSVKSVTNLALMPFFTYAENKGLMSPNDYLRQMCAGDELWSYGAGLRTTSFSFTE